MSTPVISRSLMASSCVLACFCALGGESQTVEPSARRAFGYDDAQLGQIRQQETTESDLLGWFGSPERRQLNTDGRLHLTWSLGSRTGQAKGAAGTVSAILSSDGTVESYSARRLPTAEAKTLEFVAESEADMRSMMEQWNREGWKVQSVSKPAPQTDGPKKRKAHLSRGDGPTSEVGYDDRLVATIKRGKTTTAELLKIFGPTYSRDLQSDGSMHFVWKFGDWTKPGSGTSGELAVSVSPDGTVESYSAQRGP